MSKECQAYTTARYWSIDCTILNRMFPCIFRKMVSLQVVQLPWTSLRAGELSNTWSSDSLRWHGTLYFQSRQTGIQPDRLLCLHKLLANSKFGTLQPFTVCKTGHFPSFLLALASNEVLKIKLVKMWPGGTPDAVVGTLKISLDWFLFFFLVCKGV